MGIIKQRQLEIEEVKKEIEKKGKLFRDWIFEDKKLIKNYSNFFVEYCELKEKLQTLKKILEEEKEFVKRLKEESHKIKDGEEVVGYVISKKTFDNLSIKEKLK